MRFFLFGNAFSGISRAISMHLGIEFNLKIGRFLRFFGTFAPFCKIPRILKINFADFGECARKKSDKTMSSDFEFKKCVRQTLTDLIQNFNDFGKSDVKILI